LTMMMVDGARILSADFGASGLALSARRVAPLHASGNVGVAGIFGDISFPAPLKPRKTTLSMARRGSNIDLLVFRPAGLLPVSFAVQNEQVVVVVV